MSVSEFVTVRTTPAISTNIEVSGRIENLLVIGKLSYFGVT
jgi:hypothetical protein